MEPIGLTPEMMAALRRLILGHTGTDATQLAADHAEATAEAAYVNETGLLADVVRTWLESDEFVEGWNRNPTFQHLDGTQLTPAMLAKVRGLVLDHEPEDERGDDDLTQAEEEILDVASSRDLAAVVRMWIESDEFFESWSNNHSFTRVQGLNALRSTPEADRPLLHVHIPKTAGTSLNKALETHFKSHESFAQRTLEELLAMPLARLASVKFVAGHFGFSVVDILRWRDPFIVTMSRDPVEQISSLWRYYRREQLIPDELCFEDWLTDPHLGPGVDYQVRAFLSRFQDSGVQYSSALGWTFRRTMDFQEMKEALDVRIEQVHLAAPSERVAALYRRIVRDCDLPGDPVVEFPHLNTTDRRPISNEARELIESITPLDQRFHELCIERWEADS